MSDTINRNNHLPQSEFQRQLDALREVRTDNTTDTIKRQGAIDAIRKLEKFAPTAQHVSAMFDCEDIIAALPSAQPEQLTDTEQRIFLAAMGREEKVCKKVDEEWVSGDDELISRQAVLALPRSITRNMRGEVIEETIDVAAIKALPSAQQIPWDRKTRNSMAGTLQMLRRLAYNIHGVMGVVDDDNVRRLIEWLKGGQDGTD